MPGPQELTTKALVISTKSEWHPGELLEVVGVKMMIPKAGDEPRPCLEVMARNGERDHIPLPDIPGIDFISPY